MQNGESVDTRRVVRGFGWTGFSKLLAQVASFTTTLFLVRLLDKDVFGLFAMAMLFTWVIDNITDFGFQSAIIQRRDVDEDLLSSCFWGLTVASVVAVVLGQVTAPWVASLFGDERLANIVEQVSWVFLIVPTTILSAAILSRGLRLESVAKAELGATLVRCTLSITLALAGLGIGSLIYGYLTERILLGMLLARAAGWRPRLRFVYQSVMSVVPFSLNVTASRLLWIGYSRVDTFIIGRLLGAETLGGYNIASQIAMAVPQFVSSVCYRMLFPLFSKSQDSSHLAQILLRSSVYLSIITLPVTLGMAVLAPDIVALFLGDRWQEIIPAVQVLSIVATMQVLSGVLPQGVNAIGRADIPIWLNLISLIVFGVGFYIGAQWHGLEGVLMVWLVLVPLRYLANVLTTCSLLRLPVSDFLRAHVGSVTATVLMLVCVMITDESIKDWSTVSRLILCVVIGASVYAASGFVVMRQQCVEFLGMLKAPAKSSV